MKDLIEQIMAADREANERLEAAKSRQTSSYQMVNDKKSELHRQTDELIKKELETIEAEEFAKASRSKEEIKKHSAAEKERLQALYDEHHEEWVQNLVRDILQGEQV